MSVPVLRTTSTFSSVVTPSTAAAATVRRQRRILVYCSTFPSAVQPIHGVFVKERVRHVARLPDCDADGRGDAGEIGGVDDRGALVTRRATDGGDAWTVAGDR